MLRRRVSKIPDLKRFYRQLGQNVCLASERTITSTEGVDDPLYCDVPKPCRKKSERKPYPTSMKVLIQKAKEEKEARRAQPCRLLEHPPDNGLLVPELVKVAHQVYRARQSLLLGLSKLLEVIPLQTCRFCSEVHVGHAGHEIRTCTGPKSGFRSARHVWRKGGVQDVIFFPKCFHLYDRVGKPRVGHDERYVIPRIPAILELCIQAGVDIHKYPTKRRTHPVYSIDGRIVDFESVIKTDGMERNSCGGIVDPLTHSNIGTKIKEIMDSNLENVGNHPDEIRDELKNTLRDLSIQTLESWFEMITGAKKIMEQYSVKTCGYCLEVQVGPKGHKVRMCKASKHQSRNGLHAWQEATIDDLVGPNYVWHVQDINRSALDNNLKRYYGKAPAVIELCVQAGAPVPDQYRSMMRLDVIPPQRDEVDLVA
ncbi:hypothetical protein FNV43_RR02575 [Rhamnella rubrinervis]|uniref:APO domain-containing protein n=2 Tax=Rhamnella rubrinervis TaxID=2594499 RepID=A0A8K0HST4_9ROSA|nr:hypothetical protein FNV43_RR02575 [Rhamnella rubrinervis]